MQDKSISMRDLLELYKLALVANCSKIYCGTDLMIKKFLYTILILFLGMVSPLFAADFKISQVKIDSSQNLLLFEGNLPSSLIEYKAGFSENPLRAYIDLHDCIFVENKKTIEFKNSPIDKVVIAQFSAKPNVVRLVFYAQNIDDLKNIKLIKNGNSLVFKLKNFEYAGAKIPVIFSDDLPKEYDEGTALSVDRAKFSRYILTNIAQTPAGLLLGGVGNVKFSRPFILTNPIRIVFDVRNAIALKKDFYGEYKLENGDSIKVGQFTTDTLRFVVTTENPNFYKAYISPDLQSIFLADISAMNEGALPNTKIQARVQEVNVKQISPSETVITMDFTSPIIHALKKSYNKFLIDFLNVDFELNKNSFITAKTRQFGGFIPQKTSEEMPTLSLLFPVDDSLKVETGMAQDGKRIAIKLTAVAEDTKSVHKIPVIKKEKKLPLKNKVIVVDAGHGGKDSGAISGKMYEKEPALKMAKMLQKNLEEKGAKVIMTRDDDTFLSLKDRVSISNFENADMFISIHLNSSEKSHINGIETHWYKDDSQTLAKIVHAELAQNITANDRGLFKSMFYVINHTEAPAILVETGFISNSKERDELFESSRQKATAKAIADGVVNYYKDGKNE